MTNYNTDIAQITMLQIQVSQSHDNRQGNNNDIVTVTSLHWTEDYCNFEEDGCESPWWQTDYQCVVGLSFAIRRWSPIWTRYRCSTRTRLRHALPSASPTAHPSGKSYVCPSVCLTVRSVWLYVFMSGKIQLSVIRFLSKRYGCMSTCLWLDLCLWELSVSLLVCM